MSSVNHTQVLYANFEAAIKAIPKLTKTSILTTFQQVAEEYFNSVQMATTTTTATTENVNGKSKKASKGKSHVGVEKNNGEKATATTVSSDNSQWNKILSSKDFGLTKYFSKEFNEMKSENASLNYFRAVKQLRDQFESTPRWGEYLSWVRENNPNCPSEDISTRSNNKSEKGNAAVAVVEDL